MVGLNEAKNEENPSVLAVDERSVRSKDSQQQYDTFSFNMRPPNANPECAQNPAYKTKLCRNYQVYQNCFYNGQCLFAHGFEDLAPHVRDRYLRGELDPVHLQTVPPVVQPPNPYSLGATFQVLPVTHAHENFEKFGMNGASSVEQNASKRIKYKTRICNKYPQCPYGSRCQFAHSELELRQEFRHNFFKTVRCVNFDRGGYCPYGENCHYIHDAKTDERLETSNNRSDLSLYTSVTQFSLATPSVQLTHCNTDDLTPLNEVSRAVTVNSMMAQLAINSPQKPTRSGDDGIVANQCENEDQAVNN